MNEEQRLLQILAAIENRNNHSPSSTHVIKPTVIPKIKAKLKSVIDLSKRKSTNATISQDNRDRDYAKLQKAQREWDALVAKAKLDYAMDNALLKTSNIRPINGLYSPEIGDFAGWETVGTISGGTDPLNFIPLGKIANGIRTRRLASAINKVVDEGIVGATAEIPLVRPKDIVNPEHFRYAYNNEVILPKLETLAPKLESKQIEKNPRLLQRAAKLNLPQQDAGLFEPDQAGSFGRILNRLYPKKYNFVDDDGNINMRHVTKAVKEYYKDHPEATSYRDIYNSSGNLYEHIKDVVKSAQQIPVPKGYTRKQLVESALYHDIGKVLERGSSHGHVSAKMLDDFSDLGRIDLDQNVREAVYDHMSHHMLNKNDLTKALHFADVARGDGWDDASFKYRHLSYDWNKPTLNIPRIPFREELKRHINPWLKNKGYETIPLDIPKELAWAQLEDRIDLHRSFLRGARDPLKDGLFGYYGTKEPDAKRNLENTISELQRTQGITREQAMSPEFAQARTQLAITNIPLTPTGPSRRSHLFNDVTDKNGLTQYTGTGYSKMLGVDKDKQDALYLSTSDDVASNYASTDRYGEADIVALPKELRRPGESMSEYLLRNDYEMIDLDNLGGQRIGSGAIYEDPYRLLTGRSLMSDMKKEGLLKAPSIRRLDNIIFPGDVYERGRRGGIYDYSIIYNRMLNINDFLLQNNINFRLNTTKNNGIISPKLTSDVLEYMEDVRMLQKALSKKSPGFVHSPYENELRDRAFFDGVDGEIDTPDQPVPPDDLFVDAFLGNDHVHNVIKRQKINRLPFPNVKDVVSRISQKIGIPVDKLITPKQLLTVRGTFFNINSDPNLYFPAKHILNKIIDYYIGLTKGKHFPSYAKDWKNVKPTPKQMAEFMREKGVLPRYEIEGYGDNNVFLILGDRKNKTRNKGKLEGAYGYVVGKKGEKRLEIKRPLKVKKDAFTGFGHQKDQGEYNNELKITRKTLR